MCRYCLVNHDIGAKNRHENSINLKFFIDSSKISSIINFLSLF
jgi:hypothetical protein